MADDTDDKPSPEGRTAATLRETAEPDETVRSPPPELDATVIPVRATPAPSAEADVTVRQRPVPVAPMPPANREAPLVIGRYETSALVGAGAHGKVYRAHDPTIRRVVALKVVPADENEFSGGAVGGAPGTFFKREAEAAGALLHPGIVTLYDAGRDGSSYYLAMEFVEGETFAAEMKRERLSVERTIAVVAAVAEALDFAHERGVVHRDIKPANLMILPDKSVKVADFGIARLTTATAAATMTAGMMVGTPSYMSPEQVEGEPVDGRSDLYSLGCVLYEALAGQKPFRAETMKALLTQILTVDPPPPSTVQPTLPRPLDAIVLRAMARDRERRYQRGRDLARELRAVLAPPVAPPRSPTRWLAIAAIVLVLAIGGALVSRQLSKPATGYVVTSSEPAGAEVLIDGKAVGRTPGNFQVNVGKHEIEYRKDGYFPGQASTNVQAKEYKEVVLELVPQPKE